MLDVRNLEVTFPSRSGSVFAVRRVSFTVQAGETLGIVGESGSGKTVTAHSLVALNPPCETKGEILFDGRNLLDLTPKEMESVRGRDISIVFQNPMTSLNPLMPIGKQIAEGMIHHQGASKSVAREQTLEMLHLVGIDPCRAGVYPHQLSGGMRQRVMIAIALACRPKLLIADEPTTALDVTTQRQILDLMKDLQHRFHMGLIFITHNLKIIEGLCDRVAVMYAGKIVEEGAVRDVFSSPQHPYTEALLAALPKAGGLRSKPLQAIHGRPPNMHCPPQGCAFWPRCPDAMNICSNREPDDTILEPGVAFTCWKRNKTRLSNAACLCKESI